MYREKISSRQLSAWLFTSLVPVTIQILAGNAWLPVVFAVILALMMACILWRNPRTATKWESVFQFMYVVVFMGELLAPVAQSWPVGNSDPAVPLILLGVAAVSAKKGPTASARVGAVLFWAVLGIYAIVFAACGKTVKFSWLKPEWEVPNLMGATVLLIPCGATQLCKEKGISRKYGILAALIISLGAVLTVGAMSPMLANQKPNAFYEMCRSLDLFGVARRFEALVCAGATVGWFALLTLLLTLCGSYGEKIFEGRGSIAVWICAAAAALWKLCGLHINGCVLFLTGTVFWVAIPLLTQGLEKIKKS